MRPLKKRKHDAMLNRVSEQTKSVGKRVVMLKKAEDEAILRKTLEQANHNGQRVRLREGHAAAPINISNDEVDLPLS
jgi:hypothetical protein